MTAVGVGRAPAGTYGPAQNGIIRSLGVPGVSGLVWVVSLSAAVGIVSSRIPIFATLHFVVTFGALLIVALVTRSPESLLGLTIYAGVCDVFWRMAGAKAPYEASKYALIIGFTVLIVRLIKKPRFSGAPLVLIGSLIPGAIMGMFAMGPLVAREYLVANLSGLVALSLGILALSNIRVNSADIRAIYLAALGPCVSVATFATLATITAKDLEFSDSSNFASTGGFGPNQVSSLLALGALLCILLILHKDSSQRLRIGVLLTAVWLVGQAVLTFSRGGLFSLVLAAAAVGIAALAVSGQRMRVVWIAGVLIVMAIQILSWAGAFTGGASEERFASTDDTNRTEIARADLDVFFSNPIFGVGVGELKNSRHFRVQTAAHTEYTRLPAEHGLFGLIALSALGAMAFGTIRRAQGWYLMASAGLVVLSAAQMMHSATRTGCIALGFALAALRGEGDS